MVSDDTSPKTESSSSDGGSSSDVPGSNSRGENQKPVSRTYKDNWQAIFGKAQKAKTPKAKAKKKKR